MNEEGGEAEGWHESSNLIESGDKVKDGERRK